MHMDVYECIGEFLLIMIHVVRVFFIVGTFEGIGGKAKRRRRQC